MEQSEYFSCTGGPATSPPLARDAYQWKAYGSRSSKGLNWGMGVGNVVGNVGCYSLWLNGCSRCFHLNFSVLEIILGTESLLPGRPGQVGHFQDF